MIRDYSTNTNNKKAANWVLNNKTTLQGYLNSVSNLSDYTTWYFGIKNSTTTYGGNVYLVMQKSGTAWNWNNTIKSTPTTGWLIRRNGTPDTNWNNTGSWQSVALESANMSYYGTNGNYIGLIDQTQADTLSINFSGKEWNNFYQQYATKYLEFDNSFINNSTHNGNLFTYYYQGDFYSINKLQIGSIIPNDSYYYEIYLKDNATNLIKGTIYCNVADLNIFNGDGALYLDNNQNLYVTTRLLNYSTQYRLEITSYYGSGGDNLYEDIDWFIFLPQNAIVDSNNIISFGSGDYTIQNSTNDTIDFYNDYSDVNAEIDAFFSGDTNSIVSNLNFPNLENNYFVVIYNVVSGITDTLRMSGDPYFDVSLHGETPKRIYASDFTTPPSVLKSFISMSLVFGTLYLLYMQLSGFIMLLNTGKIKDAISQIDDVSGSTLYKM